MPSCQQWVRYEVTASNVSGLLSTTTLNLTYLSREHATLNSEETNLSNTKKMHLDQSWTRRQIESGMLTTCWICVLWHLAQVLRLLVRGLQNPRSHFTSTPLRFKGYNQQSVRSRVLKKYKLLTSLYVTSQAWWPKPFVLNGEIFC